MEAASPVYEITCSWSPSTDNLQEFILVEPSSSPLQSKDDDGPDPFEHAISEESYVKFEKREGSDVSLPFTLSVSFKNPRCRVTKLSVASEARIIELYGKHGEYLSTHESDFLHEDDQFGPFYHAQPEVSSFQEIAIKFICRKSSLWVYGIKILYTIEPPSHTATQFNLQIIEDILRGSTRPLSDKAEKAMKFLELYKKTGLSVSSVNGTQPSPLGDSEPAYRVSVNESNAPCEDGPAASRQENSEPAQSVRELKNYVDVCVSEVERRVTENVNERLNRMEAKNDEKLNEIIRMLQSKP